jgi:hypothetical protein
MSVGRAGRYVESERMNRTPHRMPAVMQIASRPYNTTALRPRATGDTTGFGRSTPGLRRPVASPPTESPEQAVDAAIARIKQILSE